MKILVATSETQGGRDTDIFEAQDGELVYPDITEDRAVLTGMRSLKPTSTFMVLDTSNPAFIKNYPSMKVGAEYDVGGGQKIPYEAKQIEALLKIALFHKGIYDPEVDQDLRGSTDPEHIMRTTLEMYQGILQGIQTIDDGAILEIFEGRITIRAFPSQQ